MTTLYQKFKQLPINFSAIGLEQGSATGDYFCTPKGAEIIGRAGVDGIHYCFIEGFGDMVFAVSPCNLPGDYVHPLAKSFEDFLRLMLMCSGLDALEQMHGWSKDSFENYMAKVRVSPEQKEIFQIISEELSLEPMDFPFDYIKNLQRRFNYKSIPWKEEYREYVPEEEMEAICLGAGEKEEEPEPEQPWQVYFGEGYHHHGGKGKPGKEIAVEQQFDWNGNRYYIPAVYSCSKGLVVEFCIEIEPERIKEFLEKIEKYGEYEGRWSDEVREEMHRSNPTNVDFHAGIVVNGKELRQRNGCGFGWAPESLWPGNGGFAGQPEAEQVMKHYHLDRDKGWVFYRYSYEWATLKKPAVKQLALTIKAPEVPMTALRFATPKVGESITITRPLTGETYVLTVQELKSQEMDGERMGRLHHGEMEFPTHYKTMTYTISPDLPGTQFFVQDVKQSDQPRKKVQAEGRNGTAASSIAIIGGADGPTSVFLLHNAVTVKPHSACSGLRFEPVEEVEWKAVFREKLCEDLEVQYVRSNGKQNTNY